MGSTAAHYAQKGNIVLPEREKKFFPKGIKVLAAPAALKKGFRAFDPYEGYAYDDLRGIKASNT